MFHMPLFIFVSGCVYGICIDKGKYKNGFRFLVNKARRLLIPYYLCGLLIVSPLMVGLGFAHSSYPHYALKSIILAQDGRHLWFIFTLFMLFVIAMIIRSVILRYDGITSMVISIAGALLFFVSPYVGYTLQLANICKYFIFFMAGVYVNHYLANHISDKRLIIWMGLVGFAVLSVSYAYLRLLLFSWVRSWVVVGVCRVRRIGA